MPKRQKRQVKRTEYKLQKRGPDVNIKDGEDESHDQGKGQAEISECVNHGMKDQMMQCEHDATVELPRHAVRALCHEIFLLWMATRYWSSRYRLEAMKPSGHIKGRELDTQVMETLFASFMDFPFEVPGSLDEWSQCFNTWMFKTKDYRGIRFMREIGDLVEKAEQMEITTEEQDLARVKEELKKREAVLKERESSLERHRLSGT